MAGRSYLERVAQPLSPGEPVLFPTPCATGDEARGEAERRATRTPPPRIGRAPTAVQRRAAVPATTPSEAANEAPAPPADAPSNVTGPPAPAAASPIFPIGGAVGAAFAALERASLSARAREAPPAADVAASVVEPPAPIDQAAAAPAPSPEPLSPPLLRAGTSTIDAESAVAPPPPHEGVEGAGAERRKAPSTFTQSPQALQETSAADASTPKPAPAREFWPTANPRSAGRSQAIPPAPRIHIGAIEVRTTPPPPAPPRAPASPSASVSRGYAWRFGLIQS